MTPAASETRRLRWTADLVERARALIAQHGAAGAAEILGTTYPALSYALRSRGHSIARPESKGAMVARLYKARWPVEAIAERLGVSVKTVYAHAYFARKKGLPVPRAEVVGGYERKIDYGRAARMGREGKSHAEIAAHFGVGTSAISQAFARMRRDGIDCGPAGRWPKREAQQ